MLALSFEGPVSGAEIRHMRAMVAEMIAAQGGCYMISDMTGCTTLEPPARKFMAEWSRDGGDKVSGTAVYGVSFAMRALVTLAINAVKLIGKYPTGDFVFVKNDAEARQWVEARRLVVAAEAARG